MYLTRLQLLFTVISDIQAGGVAGNSYILCRTWYLNRANAFKANGLNKLKIPFSFFIAIINLM